MVSAENGMLQNGHLPALDGVRALAVLIVDAIDRRLVNHGQRIVDDFS